MPHISEHPDRQRPAGPPPLPAPRWATRSVPEDGGITHETVTLLPPVLKDIDLNRRELIPAEVSLATIDQQIDGQWRRTPPTVQIQGGSYSLDGVRELCAILDAFLDAATDDGNLAP